MSHIKNKTFVRQFDLSHHELQVLAVLFPLAVNSTKVSVLLFWFPGSCCAIPLSLFPVPIRFFPPFLKKYP